MSYRKNDARGGLTRFCGRENRAPVFGHELQIIAVSAAESEAARPKWLPPQVASVHSIFGVDDMVFPGPRLHLRGRVSGRYAMSRVLSRLLP